MIGRVVFQVLLAAGIVLAAGRPLPAENEVRPARKVKDVAPDYPPEAQRAGYRGVVFADAVIGEDGRVREVTVLRGLPILAGPATRAIEKWLYEPALVDGKPVAVTITVGVKFEYTSDPSWVAQSLVDALHDANAGVRLTAALMLGTFLRQEIEPRFLHNPVLGKTRADAIRSLDDVALHDEDASVQRAATAALSGLGK
jgi:TonB family protein